MRKRFLNGLGVAFDASLRAELDKDIQSLPIKGVLYKWIACEKYDATHIKSYIFSMMNFEVCSIAMSACEDFNSPDI